MLRTALMISFAIAMAIAPQTSAAQSVLEKSKRDETVSLPIDEPEMEAAKQKARATLPDFLALAHAVAGDVRLRVEGRSTLRRQRR